MINESLDSASFENLHILVVVNSGQLQKHVRTVVLGDSPLDWKPVQLGGLSHCDPANEQTGVISKRQIVESNADVIGNGPVVLFSRRDMFPSGGINKIAREVIGGIFHQRTEFMISMNGVNLKTSLVVEAVDFIESLVKVH